MKRKIAKIKPYVKKKIEEKRPTRIWYVDNLSSIAFGNAVSATLENYVYGLTPSESLDTRVASTVAGLVFLNRFYAWSRDKSRDKFNVDLVESSKTKINLHDSIYCGLFTLGYCAGMYGITTDMSLTENLQASSIAGLTYAGLGAAVSYNIDSFRDFFGVSENPKLPNRIKRMSSSGKKKVGAAVLAGYLALFSSNYTNYAVDKFNSGTKVSDSILEKKIFESKS